MKITVEYASQIKRVIGSETEEYHVEEKGTLQDLILLVSQKHDAELHSLLFQGEELHPSILLFVKDNQVRWEDNPELKEGDTVTLLSPISGG
jgi:molybdopterin converting factor small subunit